MTSAVAQDNSPIDQTSTLIADPRVPADAVVSPVTQPLSGSVVAQPSKNYSSRYLLAAALADGESLVSNCATSDDARSIQRCLQQMGARITRGDGADEVSENLRVAGTAGRPILQSNEPIDVGNAGAVLRLLLGTGALLPEVTFVTKHIESLGRRPNGDLLEALEQVGCRTESDEGRLPITLRGGALHGGVVEVSGARSSQFLSSLLYLAPLVGRPVTIRVTGGLVSKAPVRQTLEVLNKAGVRVEARADLLEFTVQPQQYQAGRFTVNGDWPGSAALLSAAVVTGGQISVGALYPDEQGEKECVGVLQGMGGSLTLHPDGRGVDAGNTAKTELRGVEFDGDLATDAVLAMMGAACFATGRTRFYNVSNLRIKECDRISEPIAELRKLGVQCWEGNELGDPDPDAIVIEGNPDGYPGGIEVDGRGDHRVIMLLSIVGLRCKAPIRIRGAHHVAKSYPAYFHHLAQLGANVRLEKVHG